MVTVFEEVRSGKCEVVAVETKTGIATNDLLGSVSNVLVMHVFHLCVCVYVCVYVCVCICRFTL